jgi:hypothetical protein
MAQLYYVYDASTRNAIRGATWNYAWYDYGNGYYYINVDDETWLNVSATGYISATFYDDSNQDYPYLSGTLSLARSGGGGGGGKK